jgi:hypothetical protein
MTASGEPPPADRDRRIVRRALVAGAATWAVLSVLLLAATLVAGLGGREGLTVVLLALCFGGAVASGWLILALFLDVLADQRATRRRLAWTAGVVLFTMASPMLVLGAQGTGR